MGPSTVVKDLADELPLLVSGIEVSHRMCDRASAWSLGKLAGYKSHACCTWMLALILVASRKTRLSALLGGHCNMTFFLTTRWLMTMAWSNLKMKCVHMPNSTFVSLSKLAMDSRTDLC